MPDSHSIVGWNSTDDAKGSSSSSTGKTRTAQSTGIGHDIKAVAKPSSLNMPHAIDAKMMRLSALTGIGCILIIGVLYFGMGNLKGSVTGNNTTIVITAEGAFEPTQLSVSPGEELLFINENEHPQVIKTSGERAFIPVQVVFTDPVRVAVPSDATGDYVLYSETLADDRTITIRVSTKSAESPSSSSSLSSSLSSKSTQSTADISIPILFTADTNSRSSSAIAQSISSSSSRSMHAAATASMEHSSDTVVVNFGTSASSATPGRTAPSFAARAIEPNPYVAGNVGALQKKNAILASKGGKVGSLHSGAPLISKTRPVRTTETGPADTLLALLVTSLIVFVAAVKKLRLA